MKRQQMNVRKVKERKTRPLPGLLVGAGLAVGLMAVSFPAAAQEIKGDAKAGEQKIAMCIGCHAIEGYRTSYPTVFMVPKIHGQTSKYLENALTAYRSGDRSNTTMRAIAGSLTDQDIADVAAYYGKPVEAK